MHFIAKPFNLNALAEKIREVLADRRQRAEDADIAMSESIEHAREGLEHAHHGAGLHTDTTARRIAMLIAVLAAALALAEMGEKGAQNAYLTHHIAASDDYAFYQAKNVRATVWAAEAGILANLPNAADAGPQAEIKRAKDTEARLRDEPQGDGNEAAPGTGEIPRGGARRGVPSLP